MLPKSTKVFLCKELISVFCGHFLLQSEIPCVIFSVLGQLKSWLFSFCPSAPNPGQ